mmetsp:Transcript_102231/g.202973  ORF Transcript_102231/g.202973 Transcript_102231/m.202973 type:complete len:108 (+) Transcript_102231:270-593(+)|eukprot:CAMPEP_0172894710 /NCGR_PEP_ID=MMETSP1075-20121228/151474_1 /TAXON_ID=2916 /ORGANISM="Ceratium fusus, Strain PA161109" /LENGTH=107 /DNA_ID=CAMNT_0013749777 /DNA_START=265 /DNA_END=588 /DNA_ORIENTATION=-
MRPTVLSNLLLALDSVSLASERMAWSTMAFFPPSNGNHGSGSSPQWTAVLTVVVVVVFVMTTVVMTVVLRAEALVDVSLELVAGTAEVVVSTTTGVEQLYLPGGGVH